MTGRRLTAFVVGMALVAMPAVAVAQATGQGDDQPLRMERLAPGVSREGTVSVTNPSTGPVTIAIATTVLVDDDNGCARPEVNDGDVTCGEGGGELSGWLDVTISSDGRQLWSGPFAQLKQDQELPGVLDPGEDRTLDVTVGMPFEAGNDTMTDQVSFDLRIRTLGVAGEEVGEPEVLGAQASTGKAGQQPGSQTVPTVIEAGLVVPTVAAVSALTNRDLPEAVFAVLLLLGVGLTVRAARNSRNR